MVQVGDPQLEDRVNALNERFESPVDYCEVRGSRMLTDQAPGSLAKLTDWCLVLPLEFKMHLLTMAKLEKDKSGPHAQDSMIVD